MTDPIIVLGAGCSGLAAAWRLARNGRPTLLLEKYERVGGLAGGVHLNGNIYEYGPHIFHTKDSEILTDIRGIMGDELFTFHKTASVKFRGQYFRFPLAIREVLFKLPLPTVIHAGLSFAWHATFGRLDKPKVENTETLLRRYYGTVLYEIFFKTYIEHVWGVKATEFSPAFARQRIPRLNFVDVWDQLVTAVQKRFGPRQVNTEDFVERVEGDNYTTHVGFSLITQRMAEKVVELGGELELGARVVALEREDHRITAVEYEQHGQRYRRACAGVISTVPINEAALMLRPPADEAVRHAAAQLRYRALVFIGVHVRKPRVLAASFMYFREYTFNRISDLAQLGFHVEPEGSTLLVAEISCDTRDRAWQDDAYAEEVVIDDLIHEGLFTREEVLDVQVFRAEHAYPMYLLGYEEHLATLLEWAAQLANFETAGRQGRFAYVNTHIAMKMGYEAVNRLTAKLAPPGM
jgi:protoporphyrinogen oxidase